ncbi:MAG: FAD-binding protein, partial [Epsilonproteobacteria bacterium]|nr:FAD-binding protein [Campylobacterota bacterium]
GGAGLSVALSAKKQGKKVLLVGKKYTTTSQTAMAQGGINAPLGNVTEDSIELHIADTIKSAHGLCDIDMVTKMCSDAPKTIEWLDKLGVPFDRTEDNKIAQRELGGASSKRACYAQDYTGLKILHTLYDNSLKEGIEIESELFLLNLIVEDGVTKGCTFWDMQKGEVVEIIAKSVVIATGGYGAIYKNYTTNADGSTGDGIASVFRAGGKISDMEFVQFHPTALKHSSILISESARGEGGYLVNSDGDRFVDELLPRDVVARAIASEIKDGKDVFLDVRHLGEEKLLKLMPQEVHLARLHEGVDPVFELIPIKPVAHYTMGGIDVNNNFEVNGLKNCYAVGECSNAKIHGANRLGGNSLLEIISLGRFVGKIVSQNLPQNEIEVTDRQLQKDREFVESLFEEYPFEQNFYQLESNLGEKFYKYAGIVRDNNQLNNLLNKIRVIKADIDNMGIKDKNRTYNSNLIEFLQFLNILDIGEIVVESAIIRDESRGAHYKEAYPNEEPSYLAHSIFWLEDGAIQNRFQKVVK